jgi:drug/metabolite transporter (DMT)-like permease
MRPPSLAVLAFGIDAALVLVFVAIGRASHGEDTTGFTVTLLPFLTGLLAGWLLRSGRPPLAIVRSGVVVWIATVVLGIALRALTGQGIAPAFIVVATLTLGVFLMGWRAVALLVVRLRARRQRAARPVDRARTPV